jgi:hypothetical protein
MKKSLIIIALFILTLFICGCRQPVENSGELIGTYEVEYNHNWGQNLGKETLTLKDDMTYTQIFKASNGQIYKNTGRWHLEKLDGDPNLCLYLSDISDFLNDSYNAIDAYPHRHGGCYTGAYMHGSQIWIIINEDLGLYYKKIK